MNKTIASFLTLFLMTFGCALAQENPKFLSLGDRNTTVPYVFLFEEFSREGESRDQFMARIAPKLRAFSDETSFEACGVIAENEKGVFGIRVGSNNSHIACVNVHDFVPLGMTASRVTIHSHGTEKGYKPNKSDFLLRPDLGAKLGYGAGRPMNIRRGQDLNMFSEVDIATGEEGYLATETGVIFQSKSGRVVSL